VSFKNARRSAKASKRYAQRYEDTTENILTVRQ